MTKVAFLSLVDHPQIDPDTIKTAIEKGLFLVKSNGGDMTIYTADKQLYNITINILFYHKCAITILGGMHMVIHFILATAVIMTGASTFGSVDKMLSRKIYP